MISEEVKQEVKNLYGKHAETGLFQESDKPFDAAHYGFCQRRYPESDLALVPQTALRLSCGCGNPVSLAAIRPGCTVVDLGCGGGIDVVLAAHKTEAQGKVLGIDMVPEMIEAAKQAVAESGLEQHIFFRTADIEDIFPLPKNFADIVIANCVINLCPDIVTVYKNIFRILRPGGILVISDIVLTGGIETILQERLQANRTSCLSGLIDEEDHQRILHKLSFMDVVVLDRFSLATEDLETIASYPGRDFASPPSQDDLRLLQGKVAGMTIMARRRPLN